MKKFYLIAAMAVMALGASAQQKLTLSTYAGTNLEKYDGKECNITVNRVVMTGWNTISLPFAVSENELNEVFGSDCRLERLVGVEYDGKGLRLNFMDCKAGGIEPNTPYILHYTGDMATKKIAKTALVANAPAKLVFTDQTTGETVTMACAQKQTDAKGLYGVLARDNAEAAFVNVDDVTNGFFATRCYIQLSNGNSTMLTTNHIKAGDATSINSVARMGENVDVYNVSGVKVAAGIRANEVNNLPAGVYVVKGRKIMVK